MAANGAVSGSLSLAELANERGITYGVVQPGQPDPSGVPILRVNNFDEAGLNLAEPFRIAQHVAAKYERSRLRGGEVLITLVGTPGLVTLAPRELVGWNVARAVGVIPVDDPLLARWIAWCLRAPSAQRYITTHLNTTVQATLNLGDLARLEVPVRAPSEMRRICGVLDTLEGKLASNHRLAERLAELVIAHTSTFLDGTDTTEKPLSEIATLHRETVKGDSDLPYVGLDQMPRGSTVLDRWLCSGAPTGQARLFRTGDILFGKLRPYFRKGGVALLDGRCSAEVLVLRAQRDEDYPLVLHTIASDAFIRHCVAVSSGARMPRSDWPVASTFLCRVPTRADTYQELGKISEVTRRVYRAIRTYVDENARLAELRDALLPRLLSGEVVVSEEYEPGQRVDIGALAAA